MKFYITTAIDYANGLPHIGHALEKVQADVIARYRRQKGDEVFFLTGTDEHGVKVVRAAEAAGKKPQDFVDEISEKFKSLKEALNLSFDDFIRTTDEERHWPAAQLMWNKLVEAGDIYKKKYKGFYCVGHEAFVTQKDLVDGKCEDHGREPEIVEEENYFFRLSKYSKEIGQKIKSDELKIVPETRKNEILSLIEGDGLEDVSFSRPRKDLSWGIPVPGDEAQTIYVWCDALTNYLSAIGYGQSGVGGRVSGVKRFERFWPADIHLIGKDILRFHAAIWPGMLLSAGLPLPKNIFVHGFISVDGRKMSKTIGNVVDPVELVKKYGSDSVRYYLLREIPSGEDGDWSDAKFKERYNGDLADGLGNLAARIAGMAGGDKYKRGEYNTGNDFTQTMLIKRPDETREKTKKAIEEFKLHEALLHLWSSFRYMDEHISKNELWKKDIENREAKIFDLIFCLNELVYTLSSFLPETAKKITNSIVWEGGRLHVNKIDILFPRLQ